jgi:MFS superfamily sulfate permease-like transporter
MSDYQPTMFESLKEMLHRPLTWFDFMGIIALIFITAFLNPTSVGIIIGLSASFFFLLSLFAQYQVAQSALRIKQNDKDIVRLSNEIISMVK